MEPALPHKIIIIKDRLRSEYLFHKDEIIIGRSSSADLKIDSEGVSRLHVRVILRDRKIFIEDLGSQNGTQVDGLSIPSKVQTELKPEHAATFAQGICLIVIPSWTTDQEDLASVNPAPVSEPKDEEDNVRETKAPVAPVAPEAPEAPEIKNDIRENALQAELRAHRIKLADAREKADFEVERLTQLWKKQRDAESELKKLQESSDKIIAENRSAERNVEALGVQLQNIESKIARARDENIDLDKQLVEKRKDLLKAVDDYEVKISEAKAQISGFRVQEKEMREKADAEVERLTVLWKKQRDAETDLKTISDKKENLREEVARLDQENQKLQQGFESSSKRLQNTELELTAVQSLLDQARADKNVLQQESREIKTQLALAQLQLKESREKTDVEEARLKEQLKQVRDSDLQLKMNSEKTEALLATARQTENEIAELKKEKEMAQVLLQATQGELEGFRSRLKQEREQDARERQSIEVADRKARAEYDAFTAEKKVERLQIEVEFEGINVKKAVLEKEIRLLSLGQEEVERQREELRRSIGQEEILLRQIQAKFVEAQGSIQETESAKSALELEIQKMQEKLEANKQMESELDARRADSEAQCVEMLRQGEKKAEAHYLEKMKYMDAQVAQKRLEEERKIQKIQDQSDLSLRNRKNAVASAVSNAVVLLLKPMILPGRKPEESDTLIRKIQSEVGLAVVQALDPDTQSMHGPVQVTQESRRAQRYWVHLGYSVGAAASLGLVLILFPKLPYNVAKTVYRTISSGHGDNVFINEIHRKSEKYSPPQTPVYRDTYADNLLYAENYLSIKLDEEIHRRWTLALNDFFIGTLGVGDRAIVDFIATEAVLIKELSELADNTWIQSKDLGIKKMQDAEKAALPRLRELLGGREGYVQFRKFEKAFYEDNLKKQ